MSKYFHLAAGMVLSATPALAGDVAHGQQVFQACAACHGDRPGDLGPSLIGVVGRKGGAREDYRYSGPMSRAGFVWDDAKLRAFLSDPQGTVKGTKMPFDGLADDRDIEDVIAFLASRKD